MSPDTPDSVVMVPIERIEVLNSRDRNMKVFEEIVENIRSIGLKKPITVTEREGADGTPAYLLVCGEGRLNAFRLLGETHIPALVVSVIRRFHEAKQAGHDEVTIWGSGKPMREFLHVDDMAAASLFVFDLDRETYDANTEPMLSHINVGTGEDITILELARLVARVTGYTGRIVTDPSKPDGTMRKLMDVSRLAEMGWCASIPLEDGIAETYQWFLDNQDKIRA